MQEINTDLEIIIRSNLEIFQDAGSKPRFTNLIGYASWGRAAFDENILPRSYRMELNKYYLIESCSIGGIDREYCVQYIGDFGHSDDVSGAMFVLPNGDEMWCADDEYRMIEEIGEIYFESQKV